MTPSEKIKSIYDGMYVGATGTISPFSDAPDAVLTNFGSHVATAVQHLRDADQDELADRLTAHAAPDLTPFVDYIHDLLFGSVDPEDGLVRPTIYDRLTIYNSLQEIESVNYYDFFGSVMLYGMIERAFEKIPEIIEEGFDTFNVVDPADSSNDCICEPCGPTPTDESPTLQTVEERLELQVDAILKMWTAMDQVASETAILNASIEKLERMAQASAVADAFNGFPSFLVIAAVAKPEILTVLNTQEVINDGPEWETQSDDITIP